MPPSDNAGKVLTKRLRSCDGTTLVLRFHRQDAQAMRTLAQSIRLKGDKRPSLSLLARRAMRIYVDQLQSVQHTRPEVYAAEVRELERMVTPVPKPAPLAARKVAR